MNRIAYTFPKEILAVLTVLAEQIHVSTGSIAGRQVPPDLNKTAYSIKKIHRALAQVVEEDFGVVLDEGGTTSRQ